MKKNKHTLKLFFLKSIIYAVSAITITCVAIGIYSFSIIDSYINKMIEDKLVDVAVSVSAFVGTEEELFTLGPGQEEHPVYQRALARLREIRSVTDITYLYIAKKDEAGKTVFVIDADEEAPESIGVEYVADDEEYREIAFSGKHVMSDVSYDEELGNLITGYSPVRDKEGNVIAILGADYNVDVLQSGINRVLLIYVLMCLSVIVIMTLLFLILENSEYRGSKRLMYESIAKIKSVSSEIANSSNILHRGNGTLSDNTNSSLSAVNEMTSTMDETSSMISQNNINTQRATEHFRESSDELKNSMQKVEELDISITSIKDSSAEICKIIELINNISKKTKILALNAEVEAARVGEAGKGFAVVAQEVEELAVSSENAAKDINYMISHNISLTEKAVTNSNLVNTALSSVTDRLVEFSKIISEVSMSSAEQEKGLQYLTSAAAMIEQTITSNADLANEIKNSADMLMEATDNLNLSVENIESVLGDGKQPNK